MKSMLCEASSVIKAIESVWKQSGKPSEFSIKVLEAGEKGILWFTKQPAIVSMSFDPKKQTEKELQPVTEKRDYALASNHSSQKNKKQVRPHEKASHLSHEVKKEHKDLRNTQPAQATQQKQHPVKPIDQKAPDVIVPNTWTDEQISDISQWLQETVVILKGETKFTTTVDKKTLRISIDQYFIPGAEENKTLYISLGNLFMQALKKKHKKKFQGFNIIITLKGAPANGNQKSTSGE